MNRNANRVVAMPASAAARNGAVAPFETPNSGPSTPKSISR